MVANATDQDAVGTLGRADEVRPKPLWLRAIRHRIALIAGFDIVFVVVVGWLQPGFLGEANIVALLDSLALPAIVVVPTVLLLAAGRFDLSVDGVAALGGVVAGELASRTGVGPVVSILAGLSVGCVFGLANGVLIELVGINPLIATLGTWWISAGVALGVEQGGNSFGFGTTFDAFGGTRIFGLLISEYYAIPVVICGAVLLAFMKKGSHVLATGGNREAARLNGIKVRRIGIWLYVFSGAAAAFAGVVFAARIDSAVTDPMSGLALQVIASAVIGGSSLFGGRGTVIGALLGLLLFEMMNSAAIFLSISPYWQEAITGVVLIAAVYGDIQAAGRDRERRHRLRAWLAPRRP